MQITKSFLNSVFYFSVLFFSCKKISIDPKACTGSCKRVYLSGKVIDVYSGEGIKNTEVLAHFYQWKSTCFYCFDTPVETSAKTTTDDAGSFNFSIIVDAGIFDEYHHYSLGVFANANDSYFTGHGKSFNKYEESFSNIVLTKYSKTKLNIKFKRDSLDIFSSYTARYIFEDNINGVIIDPVNQNPVFGKLFSQNIPDSAVEVFTAGNFWTKINGIKFSATGVLSRHTDSIFCSANATNNIVIKY